MSHPLYRDAHATDDHYAPVLFCAGAAGDMADSGVILETSMISKSCLLIGVSW